MICYRIARSRYIEDLSGAGARIYGGRWNHKGIPLIYASESRSLAVLEILVNQPITLLPEDFRIATLDVPDRLVESLAVGSLPENWRSYPAPEQLADIGTQWAREQKKLALKAPSAVVEGEYNILINPLHPGMKFVSLAEVRKFVFDSRLVRRHS